MPKIYYAHFIGLNGFRLYTIVADSAVEAKRIALEYDKDKTVSGDRLIIFLPKEVINEVIDRNE